MHFKLTEALQFSALIPSIFLVFYILTATKNKKLTIIPAFYFISIALGLLYKIMPAISIIQSYHLNFIFLFADAMLSAFSFLLILQMTFNNVPAPIFWSIIAVPGIATSPYIHAFLNDNIACIADIDICFSSEHALHLNIAIVSSFVFLLLIVIFSRQSMQIEGDKRIRKHKYWIIICLIIYNLILIGIEMGFVTESINVQRYDFSKAMVEIAFIYMIMTSIFRVFSDHFEMQPKRINISKQALTEYEKSVGNRAERILTSEKVYREAGFNRASFAKKLGVREHVLSRIINLYFNKSFSELANEYRISEAKELLKNESLSVTEISYDVGFSSITSFNRVFKEMTNISPSEFRLSSANIKGEKPDA